MTGADGTAHGSSRLRLSLWIKVVVRGGTKQRECCSKQRRASSVLSVWGHLIIIFLFSFFYARVGMLSKCMGERFPLSKDEPLTPNIDGVMAL